MARSSTPPAPETATDTVHPPRSLHAARVATGLSRGAVAAQMGRTFGGRALGIGILLKLFVLLAAALFGGGGYLGPIDTAGSVAIALGGAYFLWVGGVVARRRLLWRVRRKLIISYIFIGAIPALLIIAFFLLGGYMLLSNVSSYLVQNRLREMSARALAIADATALEARLADGRDVSRLLARRQATLARETPAASVVLIPMTAACGDFAARRGRAPSGPPPSALAAGPWAHVEAPHDVPDWIQCEGFSGVIPYRVATTAAEDEVRLVVRAVALPQGVATGYAAVIDVPIDDAVQTTLREDTSVDVTEVRLMTGAERVLRGRASGARSPAAEPPGTSVPQLAVSFLSHRDWTTGATGTLQIFMQLNIRQLYARLVAAQGSVSGVSLGNVYLFLLLGVGVLFLFIQAVAIFMGMALARSITGSVHELFVGTTRVQQGDFAHRIGVTARDQLGALAESFNSMTGSIEKLLLDANEKKRLEEELRIAHEIQMSLLPQAPATIPGLSIAALCVPAREVGGDYYDFMPLDEHRLGFLIADVAGKGTSAALYMAELKGLMLSLSRTYDSPRELLIMANRLIAAHLDARSFITMTYAVIDLRRRTLTYARAGHTPLLYLSGAQPADDRHVRLLAPDGLVLGLKIDDGTLFERLLQEQTIPLRTGDVYLLFTDGMTEAMNPQDDCFGEQRLGRIVEEHAHLPCAELRERMLREIEAFVGVAPQHDDMTMILLKVDALPEGTGDAVLHGASEAVAAGAGPS